jgi:hypothetical protein
MNEERQTVHSNGAKRSPHKTTRYRFDALRAAPGANRYRAIVRSFLALGVTVLILTVAPTAGAEQARLFSGSFGGAGSTPANPYPLGTIGNITVDNASGDVYVSDPGSFRIEKFDATGHFLFLIGSEVNRTAVEEGAGRSGETGVCPAAGHPLDVCQAGTAAVDVAPGTFLNPQFLAADNSTGSSKGDLYVANTGEVDEVQEITVTATGGKFTLSFEGETTSPLPFNADPGPDVPVLAALDAHAQMRGIEAGGAPQKIRLTFTNSDGGHLNGKNVPQVTCDGSGLTGPGASCAVTTKREGFTANVVEKFDPEGQPITSWGEGGTFAAAALTSPPAPLAGPFGGLGGIAVDPSGDLWVSSAHTHNSSAELKVFEFNSEALPLAGWTGAFGELALDASDNLYVNALNAILQYRPNGSLSGAVAPSATELTTEHFGGEQETVDPATNSLYVSGGVNTLEGGSTGIVRRYDLLSCHPVITHEPPEPGCAASESFGGEILSTGSAHPLAINSLTDALYVADQGHVISFSFLTVPDVKTTSVADPTATTATLTGTVDPDGIELNAGLAGCRFEWGTTTAPYEHTAPCDKTSAQIGTGTAPVEVHAAISGLQAGTTYHYRLAAGNANDVNANITEPSFGQDVAFGPPLLQSESALDVTATSATIEAAVNPNGLDTHVRVEYGTEAGYTSSTPSSDIGAADTVQAPALTLNGLTPGTTYHYRVVAENLLSEGPQATIGPDHSFSTQTDAAALLPDHRGWEVVSPPSKHGAIIKPPSSLELIQAASDGGAITYTSSSPTEPDAAGNADEVQILSVRGATGWVSKDLVTPNVFPAAGSKPPEYKIFSTDLSHAIVEPGGEFDPEISAEASEQTPYLRSNVVPDDPGAVCTIGCYRPLVTGAPGFANVPPGTKFGHSETANTATGVEVQNASSDLTHIVLSSAAPLIEGAPKGLYEWVDGHLQLIDVLPREGGPSEVEVQLGGPGTSRHAVSSSGSRVIWTETAGTPKSKDHIYETDTENFRSVQLDVNHGGSGKGMLRPTFLDASADGSTVYFTDGQQLTPDSGAALDEPDLYRCQLVPTEEGEECDLTDLTPAHGGLPGGVQGGLVAGTTEDGSVAYFVANGVLAGNQVENGAGAEEAQPGNCGDEKIQLSEGVAATHCSLYGYRDGTTTFIATVSGGDRYDFGQGGPASHSPNGAWLTFMSERSLTGYDNRERRTGKRAAEVYLYDATAPSGVSLRCISCEPSGARPHGEEYHKLEVPLGKNNRQSWEAGGFVSGFLAASATTTEHGGGDFSHKVRSVTDDGRVFFDSLDGLVPHDANGTEDVYEFEPAGVGTCELGGPSYVTHAAGCVNLLSGGASEEESMFVDASEDGSDAFFETTAKLSPRDLDGAADVYDARVDGGDAAPEKPIECQGDACQGFVEPPNDTTPGSLIFSGPGNLKPLAPLPTTTKKATTKKCPKGKRRDKRKKCVKTRRKLPSKHHKPTKRKARTRA